MPVIVPAPRWSARSGAAACRDATAAPEVEHHVGELAPVITAAAKLGELALVFAVEADVAPRRRVGTRDPRGDQRWRVDTRDPRGDRARAPCRYGPA